MTQLPREITALVRRRAWTDPIVRSWWLIALVMAAIAMVLGARDFREWSRLSRAIGSGVVVAGKVTSVEHDTREGRSVTATSNMSMRFSYQGRDYDVAGQLSGLKNQTRVGATLPVHLDPDDPYNWTVRDTVPSLPQAMIGPILVTPVALACGLIALLSRRGLLRTYRQGARREATVSAIKQTPLAPRSRAIRCSLVSGGRMMEVFVPQQQATLAAGDKLDVILPVRRGRPIALGWFEGGQG